MVEFDDLISKTIVALESGKDDKVWQEQDCLKFTTADGEAFGYAAVGDCCSLSWFNHLSGLDFLIGQRIVSIQEKSMREISGAEDDEGEYENSELKIYGWTFTTTLGYVDLEMRNASNGYYGGWVEKMDLQRSPPEWKPVAADF